MGDNYREKIIKRLMRKHKMSRSKAESVYDQTGSATLNDPVSQAIKKQEGQKKSK